LTTTTDDSPTDLLLLVTDQERYDLTGENGPTVDTSALDGLAAAGVVFDRAFTPISICSSARASMLTGRYPHTHGLLNNVHEPDAIQTDLDGSLPTYGEWLADRGYDNSYLGKWHVGRERSPADFGFSHVEGDTQEYDDLLERRFAAYRAERGFDPDGVPVEDAMATRHPDYDYFVGGRTPDPVEATRPYYIAERTIARLEAAAADDDPFCHRTDFVGPHHPYVVPEPYASRYDPDDIEPWPSYDETFEGKPTVQENYVTYRGVDDFDWAEWAELLSLYFGFMDLIDDQIGRILEAVDDLGLTDDLLVVHTSDHGDFAGSHRQFNKGPLMYDDTYHVPLCVRGPGVDAGRRVDALVSHLDLFPTLVEAAGGTPPAELVGESLWPRLRGETTDRRDAVFAEYHGDELGLYSQRMVRTERYKYVYNAPDVDELYDLERDPHELQNLVDHPEYETVGERLRGRLVGWMDETDDPIHEWTARHLDPGDRTDG
jgi:arylsulfatase A-like enzyme